MNPTTIYSKSGKGVQEASGKTSLLARADRAVLSAIDGRATLAEVAQKCGKSFDAGFEKLVKKLDQEGFIREVAAAAAAAPARPVAAPGKPAAAPAKVTAKPADSSEPDLDFSLLSMPKAKPVASPPPPPDPKAAVEAERRAQEQASPLIKARQEADARAQKERDRIKAEADAKLRGEAVVKGQAELEARLRSEAEAKVKAAREAAVRAAAEVKAKADAEMRAAIEAERKKAEAERQKAEAERKVREEAEQRAREEAERARKEAEEKASREAEELRKKLEEERAKAEAERKAREEAERKAREETERRAREAEEKARAEAEALRRELEEERRKLEQERRQRAEDEERRRRAEEEERRAQQEAEAKREAQAKAADASAAAAAETTPRGVVPPPPAAIPVTAPAAPAAPAASFDDNLLAELDSFGKREEEERKAKEEAEREARAAAERKAKEEAERRAREEAERKRHEDEERRRQEEEARHAREDEERRVREEAERVKTEAEERKRKARETFAAARQAQPAAAPAAGDDIGVTDDDLDMEDVKQDERVLGAAARSAVREREAAKSEPVDEAAPGKRRRPVKWGKALAITLAVLLAVGVAAVHVMPVPTADYEKAASAALGRPVKIGSARLSLFSGLQLRLQGVSVGDDIKVASVHAYPEVGALFGERKSFRRMELEGMAMPQQELGPALFGKLGGGNFSVARIDARQVKLLGPLPLPSLDAEVVLAEDGALRSAELRGPENLAAKLTPKGAEIEFDLSAGSFTLPVAPEVTLNQFAMKGTATPQGMSIASWDGAALDGRVSGNANLRWGATWEVEGALTVRGMNAAVFAPALLSEGKAEATGRFSMSAPDPAKLMSASRIEGSFTISKGVLGSFDLSRAIQSGGKQASGRTQFSEMAGQGVYDKGAVALRNVTLGAGALNAGVSADIAQGGALSGRIVADLKAAGQTLRATLNLGGTAKEPQVRN